MNWRYPLSSPNSLCPAAVEAACAVLKSGRFTMGDAVAEFETEFAAWVGSKHAVMVNSGSSANLLAVEAMLRPSKGKPRWNVGDEVLVPALAWSTTVTPLIQLGLVPVFVDVYDDTLGMDCYHAQVMRSNRTIGAIPIHVLGCAAILPDLAYVIEDCCEAFGAFSRGRSVGTRGLMGTFSHFFSHQLTTMEGGTIVTDDDAIADDLRSMRAHGWSRNRRDKATWEAEGIDPHFLFVTTGYNVRPLEVQGAIGRVQLAAFDRSVRWRTARLIHDSASAMGLRVPGYDTWKDGHVERHTWMNVPLLVQAGQSRDAVVQAFHQCGIETRPILAGNLLKHPALRGAHVRTDPKGYPVADRIMRDGFMIGCHPHPELEAALADVTAALKVAA